MNPKRVSLAVARLLVVLVMVVVALVPAASVLADTGGGDGNDGRRPDVKFTGVVSQVPAAAGQPWIIGGQTVAVDGRTRIVLSRGPAAAGQWADVDAVRQSGGALLAIRIVVKPPEVRIKGPISAKPANPDGVGDWTIAGQKVAATADTRFNTRQAPLEVGGWAEVIALEEPAGSLEALRMAGIRPLPEVEVVGAIQAFSATAWTLSSIPLALDDDTLVLGAPQVGLIAHAAAEQQEDGSLLALRLRVLWNEPGSGRDPVELAGAIEALPRVGLIGAWQVAGRQVMVTAATAINQEKGLAVVGAQVKVVGWQIGGRLMAARIVVLSSPLPGGQHARFAGRIEALPTGGLIGVWTIAGQSVQVTDRTRIGGAQNAKVGAWATGEGILQAGGTLVAAWIQVRPLRPAPPTQEKEK